MSYAGDKDNERAAQSDQGLRCPFIESMDSVEHIDELRRS